IHCRYCYLLDALPIWISRSHRVRPADERGRDSDVGLDDRRRPQCSAAASTRPASAGGCRASAFQELISAETTEAGDAVEHHPPQRVLAGGAIRAGGVSACQRLVDGAGSGGQSDLRAPRVDDADRTSVIGETEVVRTQASDQCIEVFAPGN